MLLYSSIQQNNYFKNTTKQALANLFRDVVFLIYNVPAMNLCGSVRTS